MKYVRSVEIVPLAQRSGNAGYIDRKLRLSGGVSVKDGSRELREPLDEVHAGARRGDSEDRRRDRDEAPYKEVQSTGRSGALVSGARCIFLCQTYASVSASLLQDLRAPWPTLTKDATVTARK